LIKYIFINIFKLLDSNQYMKGVILCASSKNTSSITQYYINEYYNDVEWFYLDTDSTKHSDYIGSMFDLNINIIYFIK